MFKNEQAITAIEAIKIALEAIESDDLDVDEYHPAIFLLELSSITLAQQFERGRSMQNTPALEYYQLTQDHLVHYASPTQPKRKTSRMDRREGNRSDAQNMARELLEARERLAQYENK
ncbi:hypothetical protein L7G72_16855 [Xenorhabdus bovienii]|uniref:hypothetical protein n=1 Tax=Xenorhabdus bovienii TaxID=40576 RepID=UPI001EDD22CD|nr:hypothetical protein [Xenorhabdus bovienii]MCG3463473.1 hypothetical protein [Xenorhabdus bovienii]